MALRIALDCRSVFPGMGGIGRYAATLAGIMPGLWREAQFHLLATERIGEGLLPSGPNVCERRFACGMIDERWEQLELPGELAGIPADLYHNTCFSLPVAGGARCMVATVHDVIFRRHPGLVDERLAGYLDRWTAVSLDSASLVITVSEFSKREICELYGADGSKVRVIYNGLDPRFARGATDEAVRSVKPKLGLTGSYVLYVGALEEKKNIRRLLAAWGAFSVRKSGKSMQLVLAGGKGGKDFDAKSEVERAGVGASTVLAGHIPDNDLPALMCGAAAFIYPSLYEGFGLPVIEAMACGTPVVTSKTSSLGEVAGDAARLVDPESVEEMAVALEEVVSDRALSKELVRRGRERAREFTPERCAEETLAIYREALGLGAT